MKVKIKKAPQAKSGAKIEQLTDDTSVFRGPSHQNGGIPFQGIEVEGGEPLYKSLDGSQVIFGNMQNPLTGKKFKADALALAKKEQKVDKLLDKGVKLVNTNNPNDRWEQLAFNSGQVMMEGGMRKKQELKQNKEHLATLQQTLLQMADEMGADPGALSKGKIKAAKGFKFNSNTDDPTPKLIKGLLDILDKKGIKYQKPSEGQLNKGNHMKNSRHYAGEAVDLVLDGVDPKDKQKAYQMMLGDADVVKYLHENKMGILNEYDPAKRTAESTGPHLHIGTDKKLQSHKEIASRYNTLFGQAPVQATATNPFVLPSITPGTEQQAPAHHINPGSDYTFNLNEPPKKVLPSNAKGLSLTQVLPEMYAAATNHQEPVWMQQYNPQLYQGYQVSLQDRLNDNTDTFNGLQRIAGNNPEVLAQLAAQKYSADNSVRGQEFRMNQGIEQDITNKNISLLNDAQLKNLSLADTQYGRQAQAKSTTKATNLAVLSSVSNKILQNQADQQRLKLYENLYDYRFDDNGQAQYMGTPGGELIDWSGTQSMGAGNATTKVKTDAKGNVTSTEVNTPGTLDTGLKKLQLQNQQFQSTTQWFNQRLRKRG